MAAGDHDNLMQIQTRMYQERFSWRILLEKIEEALACTSTLCQTKNFDVKLANATIHVADCRQGIQQCSTCIALNAVVDEHWNVHRHRRAQRIDHDTRSRNSSERSPNVVATGVMLICSFIFSMGASFFYLNNADPEEFSEYFWLSGFLSAASKAIFIWKNFKSNHGLR